METVKETQKIGEGAPGPGRPKGTPNRSTAIVREAIARLLENNAENMETWLKTVAEGDPENNIKPQPDKALDIIQKMAEYHIPKLARTEVTGDANQPIHHVFGWMK
jgi:hypothetical protein